MRLAPYPKKHSHLFAPFLVYLKVLVIGIGISLLICPPSCANDYTEAVTLYQKKEYSKALPLFVQSEKDGSQQSKSAYYIALCYHQLRKGKEARIAYRNVIQRYPHTDQARQAVSILTKIDPGFAQTIESKKTAQQSVLASRYQSLPEKINIPYKKLKDSGHMVVNARINGVSTKMLFDTGAAVTFCRQSYLDKLGIRVQRTTASTPIMGAGGQKVQTRAGLVEVNVGTLFREIPIVIQQDEAIARYGVSPFSQLPILGQNYYSDFSLEVDDGNKLITFHKIPIDKISSLKSESKEGRAANDNEVPFRRSGNNIYVTAKVNGRECEMIFDTGADSVVFSDRHLSALGINRPTSATSSSAELVGGKLNSFAFHINSIKLGPIERKNVLSTVTINSTLSHPLLGQTFLKGLKYTIDPTCNIIRFDPSSTRLTY